MGELKKMTYEDLYFYCKDKNPDEEVVFFNEIGFNKHLYFIECDQRNLYFDKENKFLFAKKK